MKYQQSRLQASPTSSRSWKKLLPSVCITQADDTEEGSSGGGGASASQNQILLMCQQHTLVLLLNIPQNHTNLEVLNTTLHASSKPGSTWTDWKSEGTRGCLSWPSPAPGRLSSPPLGGTVLQDRERDGLKSLSHNLLFLAVLNCDKKVKVQG